MPTMMRQGRSKMKRQIEGIIMKNMSKQRKRIQNKIHKGNKMAQAVLTYWFELYPQVKCVYKQQQHPMVPTASLL